MISKILIANRGEIAVRIIKTCKKLNIKSVVIYANSDKNSLYVNQADESYCLGSGSLHDTYLNIDKIINIALDSKCDAVHPGYGFLSENSQFAQKVIDNKIRFIGPKPESIASMAVKSEAKDIAVNSGVAILPSLNLKFDNKSKNQSNHQVDYKLLEKIGYPLLIKAAYGGGGKGMRIVNKQEDLLDNIDAARREALKSFGHDDLIIEKYLINPRHIEVQILCDQHGNNLYLFERDCSLQRRYQKIIEEAPAFGINNKLRTELGNAALKIAKAVDYIGAGTIEFLMASDNSFYFMEMNTRLQVEHPVTELITNIDLVEQQIKIADGEKLNFTQDDLTIKGHAIEARLYAEDVVNNFLPVTGSIDNLEIYNGNCLRLDTGIKAGDKVTIEYDPMLAKLIAWGSTRKEAIDNLIKFINNTYLTGIKTNKDFLAQCLDNNNFRSGQISTSFISENLEKILSKHDYDYYYPDNLNAAWIIAAIYYNFIAENNSNKFSRSDKFNPWKRFGNWRSLMPSSNNIKISLLDDKNNNNKDNFIKDINITVLDKYSNNYSNIYPNIYSKLKVGNTQCESICHTKLDNSSLLNLKIDNKNISARLFHNNFSKTSKLYIYLNNIEYIFDYRTSAVSNDSKQDINSLVAPMPGTVVVVKVKEGSKVEAGDVLLILEAMKMEHTITATKPGLVKNIHYNAGEQVELGAELLIVE